MKICFLSVAVLVACSFLSCNKHNFNYPPGTVGSSKIVYLPVIAIKGTRYTVTQQGQNFVDSGVTATVNNLPVKFTTDPVISASTAPGIYFVTYTAVNPLGFAATDWRTVVVVPTGVASDPVVSANDFSGTYLRAATGVTSTWTKIATGVYLVENPGGASSGVGKLSIATNYSGYTISIPTQTDLDYGGTINSGSESYSPGPPATYSWKFFASGYGTGLRTFVKQ
jgi:hypothetical protein